MCPHFSVYTLAKGLMIVYIALQHIKLHKRGNRGELVLFSSDCDN